MALFACTLAAVAISSNAATASAKAHKPKASKDPVVAAITSAGKHHTISAANRKAWLHDWAASARAQHKLAAHSGYKAAQIAGARAIATNLARHHRLFADRLSLVMAGVHATTDVMLHRGTPTREARIKLHGDAATYGFYPGWGIQLQPLFTFSEGNQRVTLSDTAGADAIAARMLDFDSSRHHFRAWEYAFPWQGATQPWISAMTQATAMQFYSRTWQLNHKPAYLDAAKAALPGFLHTTSQGGVMTFQGSGRWYLLYPFNPKQRILNGTLQSLLGLNDYANITGDARGTSLVQDGINGVVPLLGKFDTGAWSRYQYGQEADLNYHELMTLQLNRLGNRTGIQSFSDLGARFAHYRITPPVTSTSTENSGAVYPVADGYRDTIRTTWFVDKYSAVQLAVMNDQGKAVRVYRGSYARGTHPFVWDGQTEAHRPAPAGSYFLKITATDVGANRASSTSTTALLVRADTTAPEILHVRLASAGAHKARVTVKVRDTESGFVTIRIVRGSTVVGKAKVGRHGGVVMVPIMAAKLAHATIYVTDSSGNRAKLVLGT